MPLSESSDGKLPLSVVIIAKNAENHLPRCLKSIQSIAQEIILIHNDCTDDTVKIAEDFGAKTVEQQWLGFRDQKNVALDHANQPWILSLDSDEELSPELQNSIYAFVKLDDPSFSGAYFPRKVWFMGKWITHGDWYPDYSLRLLRKDRGRWTGGVIHEKLEVNGSVKKLKGDLQHYPIPNMKGQLTKLVGYSDLYLEQQLEKNRQWSAIGTIIRSVWRFFRAFFFRLGFLDGYPGLYIAWWDSFSTFFKYSRLYEHRYHTEFPEDNG